MSSVASLNGVISPDDPSYFQQAEADYWAALQEISRLVVAEQSERANIAAKRRELDALEAQWIAQGLVLNEKPCTNERERNAALEIRRQTDQKYRSALAEIAAMERRLAQIASELESARDRRSIAKRRMDYAIATLNYLAGGR